LASFFYDPEMNLRISCWHVVSDDLSSPSFSTCPLSVFHRQKLLSGEAGHRKHAADVVQDDWQ
jgi:hypothetical protein